MSAFVSVIVVNYNGLAYLADCLRSLASQTWPRHRAEVVLVDNGSSDGSVGIVRRDFPWVRVVEAGGNLGFARGNRAGLRVARGDVIALLNNDAAADPDWLTASVAALHTSPADVAGVAAKIVFRDEPGVVNSAGLVLYRDGRGGDRGFRAADDGRFDAPAEVFGPCGCAAVYRRAAIDDAGFLDRRMFMYYEDLDLAWRMRLRGWRFVYEPRAVVRHVHCGSSGEGSPFFREHVERGRARAAVVNGPPWTALWTLLGLPLRAARAAALALAGRTTAAHALAHARACGAAAAGLPRALYDRYRVRVAGRRVPDRVLTEWMLRRPPAGPAPGGTTCASSSTASPPSSRGPGSAATSPTSSSRSTASPARAPSPASRPAA